MQDASDKAGRVLRNLTFVLRSNHVERSTAKSLTNQKIGHSGSFKEQELLTKRNVTIDRLHISVKVSGHGAARGAEDGPSRACNGESTSAIK